MNAYNTYVGEARRLKVMMLQTLFPNIFLRIYVLCLRDDPLMTNEFIQVSYFKQLVSSALNINHAHEQRNSYSHKKRS